MCGEMQVVFDFPLHKPWV